MHYFLTATCNNAPYLSEMVHSVSQQFLSKDEFLDSARLLILDDGSTDNTVQVLSDLKKDYPNLDFFSRKASCGVASSRNDLLDWLVSNPLEKNDFVTFVDGDDLLMPDALRLRAAAFAAQPHLEVVGGQLELFYTDGRQPHSVLTFSTDPEIQRCANLFECHFYGANATYRAELFTRPGMRFPLVNRCEDWLFFAAHQELKLAHIPEATLRYRRHQSNLTITGQGEEDLSQARYATRLLGLLPFGILPSKRDVEIMDAVGYLTFNTLWKGPIGIPDPAYLPSFTPIEQQPEVRDRRADFLNDLRAFSMRLSAANVRSRVIDLRKMDRFLEALYARASERLGTA